MTRKKEDHIIWDSFRSGDTNALAFIYESNYSPLMYYGLKFTQDKALVKDLIQELFEELIESGKRLGATDNIRYYLLRAMRNKVLRRLSKKDFFSRDSHQDLEFGMVDSVENQLMKKELSEAVRTKVLDAINKLSPKQQEIIYLRFYNNMGYPEIAELFDVNVQTVRNLMHRAISSLKDDFEQNGIGGQIILFLLQLNF